jgi:hypothetical protein
MMDKVKCIKGFLLEMCDADGFTIENEYIEVEENSIWEINDDSFRVVGGDVRLTNADAWIEISRDRFIDHFSEAKEGE